MDGPSSTRMVYRCSRSTGHLYSVANQSLHIRPENRVRGAHQRQGRADCRMASGGAGRCKNLGGESTDRSRNKGDIGSRGEGRSVTGAEREGTSMKWLLRLLRLIPSYANTTQPDNDRGRAQEALQEARERAQRREALKREVAPTLARLRRLQ